jgi:hypothetical protein
VMERRFVLGARIKERGDRVGGRLGTDPASPNTQRSDTPCESSWCRNEKQTRMARLYAGSACLVATQGVALRGAGRVGSQATARMGSTHGGA